MDYADLRPDNVKARFKDSKVPLINGKALVKTAKKYTAMIMATNMRCKLPMEGLARASMATGAPMMYEIAKSELAYTEFNPKSFVDAVMEVHESLGNTYVPFAIHADHLGVKSPDEVSKVADLIHEQLEAGFTSFAVDASHMENDKNLQATIELGKIVQDAGLSLEVELGEIGAKKGTAEGFTQPEEARWFIGELNQAGIHPDLLAINNGSIHGTYFGGEAQEGIQLELTGHIYEAVQEWGVGHRATRDYRNLHGQDQRIHQIRHPERERGHLLAKHRVRYRHGFQRKRDYQRRQKLCAQAVSRRFR